MSGQILRMTFAADNPLALSPTYRAVAYSDYALSVDGLELSCDAETLRKA